MNRSRKFGKFSIDQFRSALTRVFGIGERFSRCIQNSHRHDPPKIQGCETVRISKIKHGLTLFFFALKLVFVLQITFTFSSALSSEEKKTERATNLLPTLNETIVNAAQMQSFIYELQRFYDKQRQSKSERPMEVYISNSVIEPGSLDLLFRQQNVEVLNLQDCKHTKAVLSEIKNAKLLKQLSISKSVITDTDLSFLCALPKLSVLNLDNTSCNGSCLSFIANQEAITRLNFSASRFSDSSLENLARFNNLESLDLSNTPCTALEFYNLPLFRKLVFLGCDYRKDPDNWFAVKIKQRLYSKSDTAHLDFSNCPFSDKGLSLLNTQLPCKIVCLGNTRITDSSLPHLLNVPYTERLWITNTSVSDKGIEILGKLKNLHYLDCGGCRLEGIAFAKFPAHNTLTDLILQSNTISQKGLQSLRQLKLSSLNLSYCKLPEDESRLKALKTLKLLTVYLAGLTLSQADLSNLNRATVETLYLDESRLKAGVIDGICQFKNLRELSLLKCSGLRTAEVKRLAKVSSLQKLTLTWSDIDVEAIKFLREKLRNCKVIPDM